MTGPANGALICSAVIYANPCCPTCGSNSGVTYGGRGGSTGPSKDVWNCPIHGTFTTPAR